MSAKSRVSLRLLLLVCACARGEAPAAAGSEGGPCYGNGTCDADLVCTADLCLPYDPCAAVACSGHGACLLVNARPTCVCDGGYSPVGLTCVAGCGGPDCGCPPDMAYVAAQDVCIDRWEATVWLTPDCGGARYGAELDDYPAGFPDLVESDGCTGTCIGQVVAAPTTELYACSLPGVYPSRWLTWFQAKRACENAGKRLCSELEWYSACSGPNSYDYPYGNVYANVCNGNAEQTTTDATGENPSCEGGYPGIFDISGNLVEWTLCNTDGFCDHGGSFGSGSAELDCLDSEGYSVDNEPDRVGFRCCL
jgi:hypothetical protein